MYVYVYFWVYMCARVYDINVVYLRYNKKVYKEAEKEIYSTWKNVS